MKATVSVLVLAGELSGEVGGISLGSDNAEPGEEDVGNFADLDIQDVDVEVDNQSVFSETPVDETKIGAVMTQTRCTREQAVNSLLTHDMNVEESVMFIEENMETKTIISESSSIPVQLPLPSGRTWGVCPSEMSSVPFGETSQFGGDPSLPNNSFGEVVVVKARKGFPADRELGIKFETDDDMIYHYDYGWASEHSNLKDYDFKKYRFMKVNAQSVNNRKEFDRAINSLNPGDPVAFTLAKQLYSQGDVYSQVFTACRSGDVQIIKTLIESNSEIDVNHGLKGLRGDLSKLYGDDVNEGYTPLHLACHHGHLSIVQELLSHSEIHVNCTDKVKRTPFHVACQQGQSHVVRLLLTRTDIDVNQKTGGVAWTPLHFACDFGHLDIVQQLIERVETYVNAENIGGGTPLIHASSRGYTKIVESLLTHPDIDTTKKYGNKTALETASDDNVYEYLYKGDEAEKSRIQTGRAEIVKLLNDHEQKTIEEKERQTNEKEEQKRIKEEQKLIEEKQKRNKCAIS